VVNNKAVLVVVNSRRSHFEAASEWIGDVDASVLDELVTGVTASTRSARRSKRRMRR
jgi:hypothetical protein